MSKNVNNKNLGDLEIGNIELYLNAGDSPAEVGRKLGRDPSGIREEIIKKGFDISLISEKKLIEIINVLNNYPRPLKGFKTPIELMEEELGNDVIKKPGLKKIPYEKLNLHISLKDDEELPY